jgi:rRNA maturation endonuclease Nob1
MRDETTVKTEKIGGRDPGETPIQCKACNRLFGKDDFSKEKPDICPVCGENIHGSDEEDVSV